MCIETKRFIHSQKVPGKMVDVLTEIEIARSKDDVADYAANPDNAPEWYVNIQSADCLPVDRTGKTPRPLSVGSRIAFKAQFLGRQLIYTYEIVEFVPGEILVMRTADGPFLMETTYTWVPINERTTRMTLRNRGNPKGFSKVVSPFIAAMMRRANKKDLKRIKRILESKE